ncbi:adenylate/guanylate cyclase domain-containing protein [Candidatus Dojkabacteria bacterium]|nr:adenylate/guanylate cyclase domain-containing protein [Candidatus Dojkabacteria bacterium]
MKSALGYTIKKFINSIPKGKFFNGYKFKNLIWIFVIVLIVCLFNIYKKPVVLFEWQTYLSDLLLQEKKPSDQIVIITIDDQSLEKLGAWPWDRDKYADLVEILEKERPRVIGFDIIFAESREGDEVFAKALETSQTNIVFASKLSNGEEILPSDLYKQYVTYGFVNFPCDRDGKVRNIYGLQYINNECATSFSFEVLSEYFGSAKDIDCEKGTIKLGFTEIQVQDEIIRINYTGPAGSFQEVPFTDALDGKYPKDFFKDKIVLVGSTAEDISDNLINPLDGKMISGVEIQANAINTVLEKEILYQIPFQFQLFIIIVLLLTVFFFSSIIRIRYSLLFTLGITVVYLIICLVVYDTGLIMDVLLTPFAILFTWIISLITRYLEEKHESESIRNALGHYVNPRVMNEILLDPSNLKLGGEKRRMTVLFSDIRKFTKISENMKPEDLVYLMNKYFDTIAKEILENNGTIDKFVGDNVMSFWNAPINDPNHAYNACKTAINIIEKIILFNKKYTATNNFPIIRNGIGISTGNMIVGNIGSKDRFDYTVLGDLVNVAARLEGLTKEYREKILITGGTVNELKRNQKFTKFSICKLDYVRVKGKKNALDIYSIMGFRNEKLEIVKKKYENVLKLYQKRDFKKAKAKFKDIYTKFRFYPALMMSKRAGNFSKSPPSSNWDGSWNWYTK